MKYALLLYGNTSQAPHYTPEEGRAARQGWFDLLAEMKAAQVYLSNYGLSPVTDATTVRIRNGETVTTDGPFAETPEQLGGYFLLDCKDRDEAIGWAAKIPYAMGGSIEIGVCPQLEQVRPVHAKPWKHGGCVAKQFDN